MISEIEELRKEYKKGATPSMKVFHFYNKKIYPKIKSIRGTTRFREILYALARKKTRAKPHFISRGIKPYTDGDVLVLDACRQDMFEEMTGLKGERITRGAASIRFVKNNFSDQEFKDCILITANPHYYETLFKEITGRELDEVFFETWHSYKDKYDDELQTTTAESVMEDVRTAKKLFPEKNLIVHFMQPHFPFINTDEEIKGNFLEQKLAKGRDEDHVWDQLYKGNEDLETVENAYRENLRYILKVLQENTAVFNDQTWITADHGNFLGEDGFYGHPPEREREPVMKVPLTTLSKLKEVDL